MAQHGDLRTTGQAHHPLDQVVDNHPVLHDSHCDHGLQYTTMLKHLPCKSMDVLTMQVPYRVEADEDGDLILRCDNAEGGQLYPEEVSGQVLAHLLAHAEQSTGTTISKAVISVSSPLDDGEYQMCQCVSVKSMLNNQDCSIAFCKHWHGYLFKDASVFPMQASADMSLLELLTQTWPALIEDCFAYLGTCLL